MTTDQTKPQPGETPSQKTETHVHEHHTHIDASANRQLYVMIGSIVTFGALGAIAYGVWQANPVMAEAAASGLAMFAMQVVILLFRKGVIVLPSGDEMFPATKGAIRQVLGEFRGFLDRSNTLVLILLAALYALAFLAIRQAVWTVFSTFDNVWIIAGICGLLAAPFIIPGALGTIFRTLKSSVKK